MMRKAKDVFKEMINLCYEEDYPELHKELVSFERETKAEKNYDAAMEELFNIIPLFADDFPYETLSQIEEIYEEYLES